MQNILIKGAKEHNLKNVDVEIQRHKLVVVTGLSGSGKSSLAFDTIYAEGQRRYIETFSAYARQFLGGLERPDVDQITGLSPVISIEQKTVGRSPRAGSRTQERAQAAYLSRPSRKRLGQSPVFSTMTPCRG